MILTLEKVKELEAIYRDGLLQSCVPFWLKHGVDRIFGGLLTGLDEVGNVVETDKAVWLQGRAAWTFATLYNTVEARREWLDVS